MVTGFRRYVNAGSFKLLVGTIGVTVAVCNEIPKPKLGSFTTSFKENLYAVSKTADDTTLLLPADLLRLSFDKIVSVSHCHEAGECCKESAKHEGILSSATENNGENVVENRVVELSTQSFDEAVLKNDKDVFVVFYAPWCGYCKRLCKYFVVFCDISTMHNCLPRSCSCFPRYSVSAYVYRIRRASSNHQILYFIIQFRYGSSLPSRNTAPPPR